MKVHNFCWIFLLVLLFSACSLTKFVPENEYLLDKVKIKNEIKELEVSGLKEYLRQTPNPAVFGGPRISLNVYNMAGRDSSKWINRTLKRIGTEPVIYNSSLMTMSVQQLQKAVQNKGYLNAKVQSDVKFNGKKAEVLYTILSEKPYRIANYTIDLPTDSLKAIALDPLRSLIKRNGLFDTDVLNQERERIAERLRRRGYYDFTREALAFSVDTAQKSHKVDITIELQSNIKESGDSLIKQLLKVYKINNVIFNTHDNATLNANNLQNDVENKFRIDTTVYKNFILYSYVKKYITLNALVQNTYIEPKKMYSDRSVEKTYQALNSLGPVKYVNISFKQVQDSLLDCYIDITHGKPVSFSSEVEGTFTGNFWGVTGKANLMDKNIFGGAETLSLIGRTSLEKQNEVWAQEYAVQVGLKFPHFVAPFLDYDFKRNLHMNSDFTNSYTYLVRPGEFSSTTVSSGIRYSWTDLRIVHNYQLFDISYINFPIITDAFKANYLNPADLKFNPYSYQSNFIVKMGYSGMNTNASLTRPLQSYFTTRYSIESAGNVLNAIDLIMKSEKKSEIIGGKPSEYYTFFDVRYSQYLKGEVNRTAHQIFDKNNRIVSHFSTGLAVPFGNSDLIPFEKRFYSGGANSIRGWNESTLGPGVYKRLNRTRDYNQAGDIKLEMNMEYRIHIVDRWNGALFVDAGNIWTIREYETQENGVFKFNSFYKQIAVSYGAGLRLDFNYFVLRVDTGIKLYDPTRLIEGGQWRFSPNITQDVAFQFAVGYPF